MLMLAYVAVMLVLLPAVMGYGLAVMAKKAIDNAPKLAYAYVPVRVK